MGALVVAALVWRLWHASPPERTEPGVAGMLGTAADAEVAPDAFIWEPSEGWLADALLGRCVVFLGKDASGARDVFRARVRVSREGRPIVVRWVKNLTNTAIGDELGLTARGRYVAFVSHAFDAVQGITVLDLRGDSQGLRMAIRNWLEVGTTRGLGRAHIVFSEPPETARVELREGQLLMALGNPPRPGALELPSGQPNLGNDDPFGGSAWTQRAVPRSLSRLILERLFGAGRTERLEHRWSALLGRFRQLFSSGADTTSRAIEWREAPGIDKPGDEPPIRRAADGEVELVMMDMRQLELGLESGTETPRPATGPPGRGRIPEPARPRLLAAFRGGGSDGGIVVDRRLIVPLRENAPTVAIDVAGSVHLGWWNEARAPDISAARQSATMLVRSGTAASIADDSIGERSGLCRTDNGDLVYGWSKTASWQTLARAFEHAGCSEAMALASERAGLAYMSSTHSLADARMTIDPASFLDGSPSDFFYVTLREGAPRLPGKWQAAKGTNPSPAWLAAAHSTRVESIGVQVDVHAFAAQRYAWQIRPGTREVMGATALGRLDAKDKPLVAIGLGAAFRRDNQRGLTLDGIQSLPMRPHLGVLGASPEGELSITRSVENMAPKGDASELVLLVESGEIRSEARKLGLRRERAAACLTSDATLLIASAAVDNAEPLASALRDLGCRRVVELNRGRQARAFIHRAGTKHPPQAQYEETVLYGFAREATGPVRTLR